MGIPVTTGEYAYVVGRVDILHLYCGQNSQSFSLRYLFRIPVVNEKLAVLHRALDVVRMVLWVGHGKNEECANLVRKTLKS
jgi:hypothetical protein